MTSIGSANAHPTKAFFVQTITRDISLTDCILDLIDNSVDAAWTHAGARPDRLQASKALANYRIDLRVSESDFSITDNCGGISFNDAVDYAFTFGREDLRQSDGFTVGVYGIGMKRAVFKLGDKVSIRSTTKQESFEVPINVPAWLTKVQEVWDFDIEEAPRLERDGVRVAVTNLAPDTSSNFGNRAFLNTLKATIERDYLLPMMQGLTITLNDSELEGWELHLRSNKDYKPKREVFEKDGVRVEILAGMYERPPTDTGAQQRKSESLSGWYVFCNGRIVLAADRSSLTVWGTDKMPSWHRQYEGFIGVALFSSDQPSLLPMTTTKRSVDAASQIYRAAIPRMREPTRSWINYTNARKHKPDEARKAEDKARPIPLAKVKPQKEMVVPTDIAGAAVTEANVHYSVERKRMKSLASAFGKASMSYRDVGLRSFDFAFDQLVDDEDFS